MGRLLPAALLAVTLVLPFTAGCSPRSTDATTDSAPHASAAGRQSSGLFTAKRYQSMQGRDRQFIERALTKQKEQIYWARYAPLAKNSTVEGLQKMTGYAPVRIGQNKRGEVEYRWYENRGNDKKRWVSGYFLADRLVRASSQPHYPPAYPALGSAMLDFSLPEHLSEAEAGKRLQALKSGMSPQEVQKILGARPTGLAYRNRYGAVREKDPAPAIEEGYTWAVGGREATSQIRAEFRGRKLTKAEMADKRPA